MTSLGRLGWGAVPGLLATLALAGGIHGQDTWVGLAVSGVSSTYDGPPTTEFERRTGGAVGVFADVATPWRPLDLRVEGRLLRRGGDLVGGGGGEMDLLSVPLALGARLPLGPISAFPHVGLEVAYPLAVRNSADLDAGFGESARAEAAGFVGAALDVVVRRRWRVGAEVRVVRGLGATFQGSAGRLETRGREFTLRLSRPFG